MRTISPVIIRGGNIELVRQILEDFFIQNSISSPIDLSYSNGQEEDYFICDSSNQNECIGDILNSEYFIGGIRIRKYPDRMYVLFDFWENREINPENVDLFIRKLKERVEEIGLGLIEEIGDNSTKIPVEKTKIRNTDLQKKSENDRLIVALWKEGKNRIEISNKVHITPESVTVRISLLRKELGEEEVPKKINILRSK